MAQEEERQRILSLVEALEAGNPLQAPTEHLDRVEGTWRLLFSTITILVRCCHGQMPEVNSFKREAAGYS